MCDMLLYDFVQNLHRAASYGIDWSVRRGEGKVWRDSDSEDCAVLKTPLNP